MHPARHWGRHPARQAWGAENGDEWRTEKKVYKEDNPDCWPPPRWSQWALDILSADEENKKDKWQVKPAETLDLPNARLKTCCAHWRPSVHSWAPWRFPRLVRLRWWKGCGEEDWLGENFHFLKSITNLRLLTIHGLILAYKTLNSWPATFA